MELVRTTDDATATIEASKRLYSELMRFADRPTLLLISGGSSLDVLRHISPAVLRLNLSIGLVDERWTTDETKLNFTQVKNLPLYAAAKERGVPFLPITIEGTGNPAESAAQYERYLKQWRSVFRDGVIMTLLGIGKDGHIAGVLPYPSEREWFENTFFNTRDWVVGYDTRGTGDFPARVSISLHFLMQEVNFSIAYAVGLEKSEALEKVGAIDGTLSETPARVLIFMKDAHIYTSSI